MTDLSTEIHGESNFLVDLVLSFIKCGRLRQARKILEAILTQNWIKHLLDSQFFRRIFKYKIEILLLQTPGLRLRGKKLAVVIDRYTKDGRTDLLEHLMDISRGLSVIDQREFYDTLVEAYS